MTTATVTLENGLGHLASIAGAEHTRLRGEAIRIAPANPEQIARILAYANENRLVVTPTGSGARLGWGNPVAQKILLSLERMTAVREHSWQDMTCTVEAGCSWGNLQSAMAQHRQMIALDPLWPVRSTVGGIVATNDSGSLRLKCGSLRDFVLGMTVVLADGTIAKTGGKVVKNVAGYDLHKLMTGSFGTLGIITEVNFRLHPIEESARTWTVSAATPAQLEEPLRCLLDSQLVPSSVQIRATRYGCSLDVRITSRPECVPESVSRLEKIFGSFPLAESSPAVWTARQQIFDTPGAVVLKVSSLPTEICALIVEQQKWAGAQGAEIAIAAQASGLMSVALPPAPDGVPALIDALRLRLGEDGGSVVALQVPDSLRGRFDVWGCDSNALPLMREIKRQFDPNRILNPGRFAGDI